MLDNCATKLLIRYFMNLLWITLNIISGMLISNRGTNNYITIDITASFGWNNKDLVWDDQLAMLQSGLCGDEYSGIIGSMSWLLMPWLVAFPGLKQPWYRLRASEYEDAILAAQGFQLCKEKTVSRPFYLYNRLLYMERWPLYWNTPGACISIH